MLSRRLFWPGRRSPRSPRPPAPRCRSLLPTATNVVTCADGQSCDLAGPTNNIIILNETVGAFHIIGTVAASTFGSPDSLQLSTSLIQNTGDTSGNLAIIVGDTNFIGPVDAVRESASSDVQQRERQLGLRR